MEGISTPFDTYARLHLVRFLTEMNPDDPTTKDEFWMDLWRNQDLRSMREMLMRVNEEKYAIEIQRIQLLNHCLNFQFFQFS